MMNYRMNKDKDRDKDKRHTPITYAKQDISAARNVLNRLLSVPRKRSVYV